MDTYFIDYDLKKKPESEYEKLFKALNAYKGVHMLKSLWAIRRADTTPRELFDHLRQFMHQDDGLSVSLVTGWTMIHTDKTPNDIGPKTTK